MTQKKVFVLLEEPQFPYRGGFPPLKGVLAETREEALRAVQTVPGIWLGRDSGGTPTLWRSYGSGTPDSRCALWEVPMIKEAPTPTG